MLQSCCSDIICNTYDVIIMCLTGMLINPSLHTKIPAYNNYSLLWFIFSLSLYDFTANSSKVIFCRI